MNDLFPRSSVETEPEHIGDGVYATFDGWQVWLRTWRDGRWEAIALEPDVFERLLAYRTSILAEASK